MQFLIFKDARYFQIIFQCVFLCYGIYYLHWNAEWWLYATYIITSLLLQYIAILLTTAHSKWKPVATHAWKSAVISSFGLCLILKTNNFYIAVLAAAVSILSKYILKWDGKHIFNPSAFGIAVAVWVGNAWISPGQWGSSAVLLFAVCCFGFIVTTKVQKLDVSLAFLGTFTALVFARQVIYLEWPLDYFVQSISTGSLLLFSFFMITDPKTTPDNAMARILWSMLVAAVTFYLTAFRFVNGAPVWVLIAAQPMVPLLDKIFKAKQFEWKQTSLPKLSI